MKLNIKSLLLMLSVLLMGAVCSCAKHSDDDDDTDDVENVKYDEATVKKLLEKDEWSKSDYTKAIAIYEKAADEYFEKAHSILKDSSTIEEYESRYESLDEDYEHIGDLRRKLKKSDQSEMGEKNYDRWIKVKEKVERLISDLDEAVQEKFGTPEQQLKSKIIDLAHDTIRQIQADPASADQIYEQSSQQVKELVSGLSDEELQELINDADVMKAVNDLDAAYQDARSAQSYYKREFGNNK